MNGTVVVTVSLFLFCRLTSLLLLFVLSSDGTEELLSTSVMAFTGVILKGWRDDLDDFGRLSMSYWNDDVVLYEHSCGLTLDVTYCAKPYNVATFCAPR